MNLTFISCVVLTAALGVVEGAYAQAAKAAGAGRMGMMHHQGGHSGQRYTMGWSLMTPAERDEHHEHMQSMKTHDECMAYMQEHHQQMFERAKEQGHKPPDQPRRDACADMMQ